MQPKVQFHILGWITLLLFPAISLTALWYFEHQTVREVLEPDQFLKPYTLLGVEFGLFYGLFIIAVTQFPFFEEMSKRQEFLFKELNLNWGDIIFMSFCAGFGEEVLFRAGIQTWLGPWLTSFVFVAVHGYFNPMSWKKSMTGIVLFPFILILSFAYESYGLWFCVGAHFSYDLLMFSTVLKSSGKRS
ncbi:MAG: CPBP family intramembrane glutamic endopeptidase [Brumimicrobium sp.]|nr:CPBP family intramembrane glutamic endopeptidase [Brumimicrobium sp.]